MTKFEQIAMVLKTKQNVIVKDEDGDYMVISNFKDFDGDFISSSWWGSIEDAKRDIGVMSGYEKEDYKDSWEIVDAFDFDAPVFEVGQKVQILDNMAEECKKHDILITKNMEKQIGNVYRVTETDRTKTTMYTGEDNCYYELPNSCLSHPFKEEKKETIKIGNNVYDKKEFEEATKDLKVVK